MFKTRTVPPLLTESTDVHSFIATFDCLFHATAEALQYESVYLNEHSVQCAQRAAGGLCALVLAVLQGAVHSGVALIRPPGHHAEQHAAKGKSHLLI